MAKIKYRYIKIILLIVIFLFGIFPTIIYASEIDYINIIASQSGQKKVRIEWETNVDTWSQLVFGEAVDRLEYTLNENKNPSKMHVIEIANLDFEKKYYYKIISSNGTFVNESYVKDFFIKKTENDLIAPQISNFKIVYISATAAAIKWTTDIPGSSHLEYGTNEVFGKKVNSNKKVYEHLIIIKNLEQYQQYFIKIYSISDDKLKSAEHYQQFYTSRASKKNETELKLSYLRPSSSKDSYISANLIAVSFITNNFSKGILRVERKGEKTKSFNLDYNNEYFIGVTDLSANTCYDFNLSLSDIFNNKFKQSYNFCTTDKTVTMAFNSDNKYTNIETAKRSRAKLVKSPNSSSVYYIHENIYGELEKISIPSAEVFESYEKNNWADIVMMNQLDIDNIKNITLIKSDQSNEVYYLENSIKYLITNAIFEKYNFDRNKIFQVNQKHFNRYTTSENFK